MDRREILRWLGSITVATVAPIRISGNGKSEMEEVTPYGIIGQMKVAAGKRSELIAILAEGTRNMPGNMAYVIFEDQSDPNAIWITEYWESREAHGASLQLPSVQKAIGKGRDLIEGFGHRFEVYPVAGL